MYFNDTMIWTFLVLFILITAKHQTLSRKMKQVFYVCMICLVVFDLCFLDPLKNFNEKKLRLRSPECITYTNTLNNKQKLFSQYGQDIVLYEIFKDYYHGNFLDLAACWPKRLSNTYWLEKCMNWEGNCIEADSRKIVDLLKERTCKVIPECVTETVQQVSFGDSEITGINKINKGDVKGAVTLTCKPLDSLLNKYGSNKRIDYMSLDIEGSEPHALKTLGKYTVDVITIELAHLRKDKVKIDVVEQFLFENDYIPVIGFPTNKNAWCDNGDPGNNIWNRPLNEILDRSKLSGTLEQQTHDVMFVRSDSKHFSRIESLFSCKPTDMYQLSTSFLN